MPKNQDFKKLVRARMGESGERYTEAREALEESRRPIVAIDSPGLSAISGWSAKNLFALLVSEGMQPRIAEHERYRTAGRVADAIKSVSATAAVLVVENEGSELLVDEIVETLDKDNQPITPLGIFSSHSFFNSYKVLTARWKAAFGRLEGLPLEVSTEWNKGRLEHDFIPAFASPSVLIDWLKDVTTRHVVDRGTLMLLGRASQVRGYLNSAAKLLAEESGLEADDIVADVGVELEGVASITVETRKPGVLIGRGGETSKWLTDAMKEITGEGQVQFHIREIGRNGGRVKE